jgi:hypothetical protein
VHSSIWFPQIKGHAYSQYTAYQLNWTFLVRGSLYGSRTHLCYYLLLNFNLNLYGNLYGLPKGEPVATDPRSQWPVCMGISTQTQRPAARLRSMSVIAIVILIIHFSFKLQCSFLWTKWRLCPGQQYLHVCLQGWLWRTWLSA